MHLVVKNVVHRSYNSQDDDIILQSSVLSNTLLRFPSVLQAIMNVKNVTLRENLLKEKDMNVGPIEAIISRSNSSFDVGDNVVLIVDLLLQAEREYQILRVIQFVKRLERTVTFYLKRLTLSLIVFYLWGCLLYTSDAADE